MRIRKRMGATQDSRPRAIGPRLGCITAAMTLLFSAGATAADPPSEAAVKAAFVHNFAKFVEWPANSSAKNSITLCVAGTGPELATSLAGLAGKSVQGRNMAVKNNVNTADLESCHVLFLGNDARPLAVQARGRAGLLTVSDIPGFAQSGGMIGLFSEGDRIRFEINPRSTEAAGLKLSSQLMKLAKVVQE